MPFLNIELILVFFLQRNREEFHLVAVNLSAAPENDLSEAVYIQ